MSKPRQNPTAETTKEKEEKEKKEEKEEKSKKHWQKMKFWINHYDFNDYLKDKGHHRSPFAKQNKQFYIEAICGYRENLQIPLTGRGMTKFRCYEQPIITISKLFDYWKQLPDRTTSTTSGTIDSEEISLDFKSWLNQIVFKKFMNKESSLAAGIKPLKFYTSEEQKLLKCIIKDDTIHKTISQDDQKTLPFDTKGESCLFVQDVDGNFYAAPTKMDKYDEVHHSGILNNVRVKAAGMMQVSHGKITVITNFSGHYKPDLRQTYDAIAELAKQNLFAKDAKIIYFKEGVRIPMTMTIEEFLKNKYVKAEALKIRETNQPKTI